MIGARVSRFASVGAIGFLVDAGVLAILANGLGIDPILSRIPSFGTAVIATYVLNRRWTFGDRQHGRNHATLFTRYFGAQSAGVTLNLLVYATLIALFDWARQCPVIPLAIASVVAMFLTFVLSNKVVFRADRKDVHGR